MPARKPDSADAFTDLADVALQLQKQGRLEAFAAGLDDEGRRLLERAMGQRLSIGWRATPATLAAHLEPAFQRWPYIDLLAGKYVEAVDGTDPRQIWNLPSQMGKTSLLCEWGAPWVLQRDPSKRIMYVTYDADKAVEEGGKARDHIEEHAEQLGLRLRPDRRARGMWRTEEGGGLYAVGIYGGIVGWPADVMLLDDLMKGWQAAHSETERERVWSIFRSQIRMRLQGITCPIIHASTRWHMDDPTGRMLNPPDVEGAEHWTHLRLPAIAETNDLLGRQPGEPLEPRRFPIEEVRARAATLGSYLANALEQQNPTPEEGNTLLRAWFVLEEQLPPKADESLTSWDLKLKNREEGDYVVGQAWYRTGPDYWCIDQLRGQWDHATTGNAIALLAVRHPEIQMHVVESAGSADEVVPQLREAKPGYTVDPDMAGRLGMTEDEAHAVQALRRRGMSGLLPQPAQGSKEVRARAFIAPIAEARNVHLPAAAGWVMHLLDELAAFPEGVHDDQVDAMSQALKRLSKAGSSLAVHRGTVATPPPGAGRQPVTPTQRRATIATPGRSLRR